MASVRKRKRKNSKGVIQERWMFDFIDDFGHRHRKSTFKTKVEAEKAMAKELTKKRLVSSLIANENITFEQAAKEFMELHAEIHCKPSTINGYKNYLNNHLLPFFGIYKLVNILPKHFEKYVHQKIKDDNLSNNTVNKMLTLSGSIIERQINNGLAIVNPARKLKKLKLPHSEMKFLNKQEISLVLDVAETYYSDFHPFLLTAILTGVRRGEQLALTWNDINWKSNTIYINKSLYNGQIIEPKTKNSIRRVDLSVTLKNCLRAWKLKCVPSEKNLVFPNSIGGYTDPDNMIKRRFSPVLNKAGIEKIRWHDLRHTYATILIAQNLPIKYIQRQMGHFSAQVTLDRYGHLFPEVHQHGIVALDSIFEEQKDEMGYELRSKM